MGAACPARARKEASGGACLPETRRERACSGAPAAQLSGQAEGIWCMAVCGNGQIMIFHAGRLYHRFMSFFFAMLRWRGAASGDGCPTGSCWRAPDPALKRRRFRAATAIRSMRHCKKTWPGRAPAAGDTVTVAPCRVVTCAPCAPHLKRCGWTFLFMFAFLICTASSRPPAIARARWAQVRATWPARLAIAIVPHGRALTARCSSLCSGNTP